MSIKYNGGYIPAVGADGTTLVANSSASTGVSWAGPTFTAGKNAIINGDFGVWQRGTSFASPAAGAYNTDRFYYNYGGSGATRTISQQTFTPGTAPVTGYEGTYFWRLAQTVAGTSSTYDVLVQPIEDVRKFAAQTLTVSFYAKSDATRAITPTFVQNFGSGGSGSVTTSGTSITTTTSWVRYTQTFAIPSISGKTIGTSSHLDLQMYFPNNTVQTIDIWGVQVEAGSVATPFTTATGTLSGELAACQRYYFRTTLSAAGAAIIGFGTAQSTTVAMIGVKLPVTMRTIPSSTVESSGLWICDGASTINTSASITSGGGQAPDPNVMNIVATGTGLVQYRPYYLFAATTSAYLGITAEL